MAPKDLHSLTYALREAEALLRDEANSLVLVYSGEEFKDLPHRAKVAIQKEVTHFREMARLLALDRESLAVMTLVSERPDPKL